MYSTAPFDWGYNWVGTVITAKEIVRYVRGNETNEIMWDFYEKKESSNLDQMINSSLTRYKKIPYYSLRYPNRSRSWNKRKRKVYEYKEFARRLKKDRKPEYYCCTRHFWISGTMQKQLGKYKPRPQLCRDDLEYWETSWRGETYCPRFLRRHPLIPGVKISE